MSRIQVQIKKFKLKNIEILFATFFCFYFFILYGVSLSFKFQNVKFLAATIK